VVARVHSRAVLAASSRSNATCTWIRASTRTGSLIASPPHPAALSSGSNSARSSSPGPFVPSLMIGVAV
jgi:hypothetical protein